MTMFLLLLLLLAAFACSVCGLMVPNTTAIVQCNAIVDAVDDTGTGEIRAYAGAVPSTCEAAAGTLLWSAACEAAAFGAASDINPGARATMAGLPKTENAVADGTIAYIRFYSDAAGTPVCRLQMEAGVSGSGKEAIFSSLAAVNGAPLTLNTCTVSVPES